MKVIHYIPSIDRNAGGTTAYIQLLGKALGKMVDLHIATHLSANPVDIPNCRIHYISRSVLGNLKNEWKKLLTEIQPNIVHVNCCWMPQCAFTQRWAQSLGYKVVLSPHGMLEPWILKRNYWTKKLLALLLYQKQAVNKADFLHATAESEKMNLLALGYNNKITVVSNGIETDALLQKTEWSQIRKILFLSRVHPKKGLEILIEAVSKIDFVNFEIIIAGEGEVSYINQIQKLINYKHLNNIIKIIGGVYGDDKWKLYRDSDLFILPTYSENFGIVVLEALYTGLPVITTTGTPWQELNTEECGWCIDLTVNNLQTTIEQTLRLNSNEIKEMGIKGRNLVSKKYDIKSIAKEFVYLYSNLISNEKY